MNDKSITILSTRPLDESLIKRAANQHVLIDQINFIEVKRQVAENTFEVIKSLATKKTVVVFTSMNVVEILVDMLPDKSNMPDWKIYCMGGTTFTLVKKYWPYENVVGTAKNATQLAQQIIADEQKQVHFFCGNKRRDELPVMLQHQGIEVSELVIYETIELAVEVQKNYDAILFFSPSAVHSFFAKNTIADNTKLFAIGDTTAATIKTFCSNEIVLSDFPAKEMLVEKAIEILNH